MGQRKTNPTEPKTNLARERLRAGLTQHDVSIYTGISIRHYRRLESGEYDPGVRELANCAILFGVKFEAVAPDDWRKWQKLSYYAPAEPPSKEAMKQLRKQRGRWDSV